MRALVQRVSAASVTVNGQAIAQIERGFCVLLGITHADTTQEADWIINKLAGLRVFGDADDKMNLSIEDIRGAFLVVSQFTLYGDVRKGKRPSFSAAASPKQAEPLFNYFVTQLQGRGFEVGAGVFGAKMKVEIHNDGPVTLLLEREGE